MVNSYFSRETFIMLNARMPEVWKSKLKSLGYGVK